MNFNLDELKKDHRTSYLAGMLEQLGRKEAEVREKLARNASHSDAGGDKEAIILEVRAGAGGDEASLFAWELAHMYEKFAEHESWQWKTNYEQKSDLNGYKEASFEIKGKDVYKIMRYETGVHRVQRIPATEKNGRVHTSTASVAVLPIRKKIDF